MFNFFKFSGKNSKYNKNSFLFNDFNKTHGYELSSSSSDEEKQSEGIYLTCKEYLPTL